MPLKDISSAFQKFEKEHSLLTEIKDNKDNSRELLRTFEKSFNYIVKQLDKNGIKRLDKYELIYIVKTMSMKFYQIID